MTKKITVNYVVLVACMLWLAACKIPAISSKQENKSTPAGYTNSQDTSNSAAIKWKQYFTDPHLI
ncbi:MAG: TolC family protein, partial [Chitinophagaceae bacterium]|nr:TolC family protein [Chitinophagaceae bacterium]